MPIWTYKGLVALPDVRPVVWIGRSKQDLMAFPREVAGAMGYALYEAQKGQKHPHAKPLRGFGGAGVLEVVEDFDGDTFRAVYTVRLTGRVYVLHAFQKKSKHGIATPAAEMERVNANLRKAEELHAAWSRERQRII
jgi:phage-related protein